MGKDHKGPTGPATVRCAVYTRKSTEEGLEKEFNSLDAQRASAEAYIASQRHEGWTCLAERFDDGGFSGGSMDRPALKRLLADIGAGRVDAVVVYKVDRLSRSLLDFARMLEVFEQHKVAFISITQMINSATSAGRLMLNVLLSFAQFEREIISERTRDKIAAARKKGLWSGGHPLLGYDIDAKNSKLVVNDEEAARVRAIFQMYLDHESLLPVVQELERRGWATKRWTTKKERQRGGHAFTKTSLHVLLTNPAYLGKVRHKANLYDGEHQALITPDVWQRTQALLARNGRTGGSMVRNQFGSLLRGLLRCAPCGCAMTPACSTRGTRRYRYYTCTAAQKRGWDTCPSKSIPAAEIEKFVVDRIRAIGRDPELRRRTFAAACAQGDARAEELAAERRGLHRDLDDWNGEIHRVVAAVGGGTSDIPKLADLHERVRLAEARANEIDAEVAALGGNRLYEADVERALEAFDPVWATLTPREQARIVHLLVERVDFDGATNKLSITFHPSGIRSLADELAKNQKEKSA
jgi:site-specific DNA recombinase